MMNYKIRRAAYATATLGLFASAVTAQAAVVTFTAATSSAWNTSSNWSSGALPGTTVSDIALWNGGQVGTVTSSVSPANTVDLTMRNGGTLNTSANMALRNFRIGINGAAGGNETSINTSAGTITSTGFLELGTVGNAAVKVSGTGVINYADYITHGQFGKISVTGANASLSTATDYTMGGAATLAFALDAFGIGTVDVGGAFTIDATNSLLVVDASLFTGPGSFDLVTYASRVNSFAAGNISITGLDPSLAGTISYDADSMNLNIAPVPEPSTYLALLGSVGLLALCRRRA